MANTESSLFRIIALLALLLCLTLYRSYISIHNQHSTNTQVNHASSITNVASTKLHPLQEIHPNHWQMLAAYLKQHILLKGEDAHHPNITDHNVNVTSHHPILASNHQVVGGVGQHLRTTGHGSFNRSIANTKVNAEPKDTQLITSKKVYKESLRTHPKHPVDLKDVVACNNQTKCISPVLQLRKHFNVYYCKHVSHGVRFYYLVREGLLLHPNIHLVSDPLAADVIIYLPESAAWHKTECNNPLYWNKTIMLDEGDHPPIFEPDEFSRSTPKGNFLLIFKRSFVRRSNGKFQGYMGYLNRMDVLPMTYTATEAYVKTQFQMHRDRDIELLCSLRGGSYDPVRLRVRQWVEEYGKARGLTNFVAGEINSASRTVVSKQYFQQMYRSQIIVTSNPSHWEGDFRFCEALSTGAMIMIDHMFVPRPKPYIDGQHVLYYDNNNKTDIFEKLDAVRAQGKAQIEKIALQGYYHTMRYHRAANLIDFVFRTLHVKQLAEEEGKYSLLGSSDTYASSEHFGYSENGFEMRLKAVASTHPQHLPKPHKAPKKKQPKGEGGKASASS